MYIMEIHKNDDGKRGMLIASVNGQQAGMIAYTWAGEDKFIIDHTETVPDFAGQGVGKQLVAAAVDLARTSNVKVMPLCPFAKGVFDKTPDYADVRF
jgi:predicted GNAT family acetyltransferase